MSAERLICFSHGKESGPWGTKITFLADVARRHGFDVLSPDYRGTQDPHERVSMLLGMAPAATRFVLAGSSMGAYVAAMACRQLRPDALFLMAPALYFPGWDEEPEDIPSPCTVVHGWNDEIVPVERAQRFAARHRAELHLLDADHGLNDQLELLGQLLSRMLVAVGDQRAAGT